MKLLALVLLLSTFSSLTLMEVVNSFRQSCPSFFIPNPHNKRYIITPTIFHGRQYKTICQRWNNAYRFATLYDTMRRIPVYSAYTFLKEGNTKKRDEWKIEPQLEDIEEYKKNTEMMVSPREAGNIINQAVDSDYRGCGYDRGHVFPRFLAANKDQADSTFTLTNIAPQTNISNGGWANKVETPMHKEINNICRLDQKHMVYIVTGAVPGDNWVPITRNTTRHEQGINIPSHFWSAFCCTNKTDIKNLISRAYIAELDNFKVHKTNIHRLNIRLTELYGRYFRVFPELSVEK